MIFHAARTAKGKKNNNNVQNHPESILSFYGSKPITYI